MAIVTMTATEIMMRRREASKVYTRMAEELMAPFTNRILDLLVREGIAAIHMTQLRWWEKVLCWNPCNDFVDVSGGMSIEIVSSGDMYRW